MANEILEITFVIHNLPYSVLLDVAQDNFSDTLSKAETYLAEYSARDIVYTYRPRTAQDVLTEDSYFDKN